MFQAIISKYLLGMNNQRINCVRLICGCGVVVISKSYNNKKIGMNILFTCFDSIRM